MIVRAARGAAAALCLTAPLFLPAHAQVVTTYNDPSAATAAVELWYRAPSAGYDLKSPGIARLALAAAVASKPAGGSSLSEIVNRLGGSLSIQVFPDMSMVGASVPAGSAPAVLRAMTAAFFNPVITPAGLKIAAQDSGVAAVSQLYDSELMLQDALFAQLFSQGPAHYAPVPTAAQFAKIAPADVQAFASRAFRKSNAIFSLAGSVTGALKAAVPPPVPALDTPPLDSTLAGTPGETSAAASVPGMGFAWTGPRIADARAATAMDFIADYLFDPDGGTVIRATRSQANAFVGGQFVTLHDPGVLLVTLSGESAAALQQPVLDAVAAMAQPLDAATFAAARKAFLYHIMSQIQTPMQRADDAGWYAAEGNAPYAPGDPSDTYVNAVNSLDPQFVAQVARMYLQHPAIVRLIQSSAGGTTAT
jgi:predicted Zn-dependent peptidase